jgi:PKD repeat protein
MTKLFNFAQTLASTLTVAALVLGVISPVTAVAADLSATMTAPSDNANVVVGRSVTFRVTATGGTAPYQYKWNFGDGNITTETNGVAVHSYASTGAKTVTVTITDANDSQTSTSVRVNVSAATLTASISSPANNSEANINQSVSFVALVSGGTAPYQYKWNFGDGTNTTDTNGNVIHTYSEVGAKSVTLKVTDANDTVVEALPITVNVKNVVNNGLVIAIASPASGSNQEVNKSITFKANVTGGTAPYQYKWNFGDGTTLADANGVVLHTYANEGNYNVKLLVSDADDVQRETSINLVVGDSTQPEEIVFSNIRVTDITKTSAVVRWTTNLPSTSRVIYDTVSHTSIAGQSAPNYGYANSSDKIDVDQKVTDHAVTLTNLTPNTRYFYRVLSAK